MVDISHYLFLARSWRQQACVDIATTPTFLQTVLKYLHRLKNKADVGLLLLHAVLDERVRHDPCAKQIAATLLQCKDPSSTILAVLFTRVRDGKEDAQAVVRVSWPDTLPLSQAPELPGL